METFIARVRSVTDGDTVRVKRESNDEEIRVRFGGIDTPETNQRHGEEATNALKQLVQGKSVRVELTGKRSGNRMIGEIFVPATENTSEIDVSLELLKAGHAWLFWQFAEENLPRARILAEAELDAKFNRRGLFAADDPIYPRVFRRGGRTPNETNRLRSELMDREVRIVELIPNPLQEDVGNEQFVIENGTSVTVSIAGWSLRDDDGGSFQLTGQLEPNSTRRFTIDSSLRLSNNGDNLALYDADGTLIQEISYDSAAPGEVITVT